nr:MAG TPA: hypothetical protein [Caudoviricetes sp.]
MVKSRRPFLFCKKAEKCDKIEGNRKISLDCIDENVYNINIERR